MDLVAVVWAVLRHWYVLLMFLSIGAFGAYQTLSTAEQSYEVQGTYLMSASTGFGECQEPTQDAEPARGVADAGLLAAVLDLDPRSRGGADATGVRFTAMPISNQTVRVDVLADTANEAEQVLDEVIDLAMEAVAPGIEVQVVAQSAMTTPQTDDSEDARYQMGSLLRLSGEAVEGSAPQVAPNYAGRVLGELMRSSEARTEILGDGVAGTYDLERDDRDQAPIVTISAVATSPGDAATIFDRTLAAASERLDLIQDAESVGETNRLQFVPLVEPAAPVHGEVSARRPALTLFGLSGILGAGTALALDQWLTVRRRNRAFSGDGVGRSSPTAHGGRRALDAKTRDLSTAELTGEPQERRTTAPR